MDMATSFSASSVLLVRAGWRRRLHSIGEEHRICLEALERTRLSAVFFSFLNFQKRILVNILHNFHHFREEENCVRSTRHAVAVPLVTQTFGGCLLS